MLESQAVLKKAEAHFGNIPSFIKIFTERSPMAGALLTEGLLVTKDGKLTAQEREVVIITISLHNGCSLCIENHCRNAEKEGVEESEIQRIVMKELPLNKRYRDLVETTTLLLTKKGKFSEDETITLKECGLELPELIEIVCIISLMTITNFTNNMVKSFKNN